MRRFIKSLLPKPVRVFLGKLPILTVNLLGGKVLNPILSIFRSPGQKYIFIISTPRSGSTLLFHLLCNNHEIKGYGENHTGYETLGDLSRLYARTTFYFRKLRLNSTYILDKLVHNHLTVSDDIINNPNVYFIFLLREARGNMDSMSRVDSTYQDGEKCLHTYESRLERMGQMAEKLKDSGRMTVVTYNDILENSAATLTSLSDFLELDTALTDHYEKLPGTGRFRWGDNSSNILSGRIVQKDKPATSLISDQYIELGQNVFERTLKHMKGLAVS